MAVKLLYDLYYAQPLNQSKFHGGGEYMKTILGHILDQLGTNMVEVFFNPEAFLDEWLRTLIDAKKVKVHNVYNKKDIEKLLADSDADTFFTGMPYQYVGISMPSSMRKIAVIHGLRNAEMPVDKYSYLYYSGIQKYKALVKKLFPDYFSNKAIRYYAACAEQFDEIITDSVHSQYAIKAILNTSNKDLHTYYVPNRYFDSEEKQNNDSESGFFLERYLLMLGGNRWEKNTYRVILALEQLFSAGFLQQYKVVVCGKIPNRIHNKIRYLDKYVFYDFVETWFLEALYEHCDFFVYPTLNEGFGMPPLEAMKYGKTCIISAVCSLPEICGDAVIYMNPYDIKEIKNRILQASDSKLDEAKVKKRFSEINIKQTADVNGLCRFVLQDVNAE